MKNDSYYKKIETYFEGSSLETLEALTYQDTEAQELEFIED